MGALETTRTDACPPVCAEEPSGAGVGVSVVQPSSIAKPVADASKENMPEVRKVIPFPGISRRYGARVQKFHELLHTAKFEKFLHPVSRRQVEVAMEFLDAKYGRWDGDAELAVWEYLLPAIHKLFPAHRIDGYAASFGSPKPAVTRWSFPLWLMLSTAVLLLGVSVLWWMMDR
jgi:hypothetical protein